MTPLARVHDGATPEADRTALRTPEVDRTALARPETDHTAVADAPDADGAASEVALAAVELTPAPPRRLPTDSRTSPELARLPLPAVAERLDAQLLPH
jgi:hypothetical protein